MISAQMVLMYVDNRYEWFYMGESSGVFGKCPVLGILNITFRYLLDSVGYYIIFPIVG